MPRISDGVTAQPVHLPKFPSQFFTFFIYLCDMRKERELGGLVWEGEEKWALVEGILLTGRENFEVVLNGNGGAGELKHILLVATRKLETQFEQ